MRTKKNTKTVQDAKRLFIALVVCGLVMAGAAEARDGVQISFTNFVGRGTLTNFPALVQLTPGNTDNYKGFLDTTNGWDSTGSLESSATGTNGSFSITNDTVMTWQWGTNFWIEINIAGE